MTYPEVLGEAATLDRVIAGASLARYGDGEFKMCRGAGIKSQEGNQELSKRLREILKNSGKCLVGIPNIRSDTPKADFWGKFMVYAQYLGDRQYVSSFVTRPDSAPWINTDAYWDKLESLWRGRAVTLVRGSSKSLTADDLIGAGEITEIVAPRQHAFAQYGDLLKRIGRPERVLICLGPTATVMAVDLCAKGVHAIDLGHVGMFVRKHRRGESMWLSKDDKAVA
jgi:hypothetical protein